MTNTYDAGTHAGIRRYFNTGKTRTLEWRLEQLRALDAFLREREKEISQAAYADLRKSPGVTWLTETSYLRSEIKHTLGNLRRWMRPRRVGVSLYHFPAKAFVERDPLGVVLVLGTWNYPLALSLEPLIGALTGGNCVVLKPSELAPATSRLIADEIPRWVDPDAVRVVEGDGATSAGLLENRFDHILFTGSRRTGALVMQAAAHHLTPVTLELGGKSPCIVTEKADLRVAARRIVWAKFLNAGQTCIAPDYLMVQESVEEPLLEFMKEALALFYGSNPEQCTDYGRIVDAKAFRRLDAMVHEGRLVAGGMSDEKDLYIAPTIVRNVPVDSLLMQEEIFGPILPVISFSSLPEAVDQVCSLPDPLAVYLFSHERAELDYFKANTRSGGVCCNDLLFQVTIPDLPFGGRGASGIGVYHGKAGFDTFSAPRSVLIRKTFPDPDLRYPPYTGRYFRLLKRIFTIFS
ncbi:MAG: aldehyde dehydrogenase family protein [Chlorobiaceae bacterium]|nr:aldehyde dehydrogenase family protein [Chlorobiaceae bacterium]